MANPLQMKFLATAGTTFTIETVEYTVTAQDAAARLVMLDQALKIVEQMTVKEMEILHAYGNQNVVELLVKGLAHG